MYSICNILLYTLHVILYHKIGHSNTSYDIDGLKTLLIAKPSVFATKLLDLRLYRELHNGSDLQRIGLGKNMTVEDIVGEFRRYELGDAKDDKSRSPASKLYQILYKDCARIGDFVSPRNARHVLLASTFRSGSSFLGELLSRYPGTFYSYEPLMYTRTMNTSEVNGYRDSTFSRKTREIFIQLLLQVFKCNLDIEYIKYISYTYHDSLLRNFRIWNTCKTICPGCNDGLVSRECSIVSFYNSTCPKFPIRLIKTVRFRMEDSEKLLLDPDIGKSLKIILLVRDPRGVMKSRSSQAKSWCNFAECRDPDILCRNMKNDVSAAFRLRARYPGKQFQ